MFTDIMWNSWTKAKKKYELFWMNVLKVLPGEQRSPELKMIYKYGTIMYVTLTLNISQQIAKLIVKSYIYLYISLIV